MNPFQLIRIIARLARAIADVLDGEHNGDGPPGADGGGR